MLHRAEMKQTDTDQRGMALPQDMHSDSVSTPPRTDNSTPGTGLMSLVDKLLSATLAPAAQDVLQSTIGEVVRVLGAEHAVVMLSGDDSSMRVGAGHRLDADDIMQPRPHIAHVLCTQAIEKGTPIHITDARHNEQCAGEPSVSEYNIQSLLCVPIVGQRQPIGAIYVDRTAKLTAFVEADLQVFSLCAGMIALALESGRRHDVGLRLKQYFDSVIRHMSIGVIVLDARGRILTINAAALEIFDLDKGKIRTAEDEGEATNFLDTLPDDEQQRWQSLINFVLSTENDVCEPRFYLRSRYLEKTLSLRMSPVPNLPDSGDGIVMAVEDVTDKVTAEQYIILSEKLVARGEMAASVGHQLNNHLSIIANNAELMSLNVGKQKYDKVQFNCRSIVDNVFKIKQFVESLTDLSRPEPEYISYDIRHLIDDLLFSLRMHPRYKVVSFTIDLSDQIPFLEMDVGQIQQVLMNLLDNASDAIEERAAAVGTDSAAFKRAITITATFDKKSDTAAISVTDNGAGMSGDTLGRVFTLHFTTKRGGHGLGLYNCRLIAQQHGGELRVTSAQGQGSTFTLTLPRLQRKARKTI
jgi:two-component system, sporulation sensor kinase E